MTQKNNKFILKEEANLNATSSYLLKMIVRRLKRK